MFRLLKEKTITNLIASDVGKRTKISFSDKRSYQTSNKEQVLSNPSMNVNIILNEKDVSNIESSNCVQETIFLLGTA